MKTSPRAENPPELPRTTERIVSVPALRPQLPDADRLLPYLRRIDAARIYTNWGPLAAEFEQRLGKHFGLPENSVVSASSGTAALVGAILACAGRANVDRPLALVPAFTFVATALAVEQCGYRPYVLDVGPDWLLDPRQLNGHPLLDRVGLVVAVSAFGRPVLQESWLSFRDRTGIPVVIDGAASFEAVSAEPNRCLGELPVSMSFHATKTFAVGEGGCVASRDVRLSELVTQALNFGFHASRESCAASTNGKMSEYHAAVGLAELDGWPQKQLALRAVADSYRRLLTVAGLGDRFVGAPSVAGCYALFRCADALEAERVQQSLAQAHIECRLWYGGGLHRQPYFQDVPHDPLAITEQLAPLIIGLPVATDLTAATFDRVVTAIAASVDGPQKRSR